MRYHFKLAVTSMHICDMIKGNESNVRNSDFKFQAKRGDKFFVLHCVLIYRIVHISATRCPIEMVLGLK